MHQDDNLITIDRRHLQGWGNYAWKDRVYVDDIQAYFDKVLAGADASLCPYCLDEGMDGDGCDNCGRKEHAPQARPAQEP